MSNAAALQVTTPTDREIVVVRSFNAPRTLVFDCFTKPELVRRWMTGPDGWVFTICEIDLRVGGAYRFAWRGPDGTEFGMSGVHKEIVPPERVVNTQNFDVDWTGGETEGTLVLAERDGVTTTTNTILYATKEGRDAALATGMTEGMGAGYNRLAELLGTIESE